MHTTTTYTLMLTMLVVPACGNRQADCTRVPAPGTVALPDSMPTPSDNSEPRLDDEQSSTASKAGAALEEAYSAADILANAQHGLVCRPRPAGHGCVDEKNQDVVPFIYERSIRFEDSGLALVAGEGGWFYIDARHDWKVRTLTVEGPPDEIYQEMSGSSGPVRFMKDGKIGFLDPEGGVVIPAQYDAAFLFNGERALVCTGCHPQRWTESAGPEAKCSGDAFYIDKKGKRLNDPVNVDGENCGAKSDD